MKFKVLEVNDYTHSYKDKDVYTSWQLNEIKNRVRENPSRMTFDPVEADQSGFIRSSPRC